MAGLVGFFVNTLTLATSVSVIQPFAALVGATQQTLIDAQPRSCMAVLFASSHSEAPDRDPLTRCEVCGETGRRTTCEPLLVGGEVIGSVLLEHTEPLHEHQTAVLRESVSQAAPILANLRDLALAKSRASTDALTALPNQRTVKDTVKRMAAHNSTREIPVSL